jgi:hypothetical protein
MVFAGSNCKYESTNAGPVTVFSMHEIKISFKGAGIFS